MENHIKGSKICYFIVDGFEPIEMIESKLQAKLRDEILRALGPEFEFFYSLE
jgi:hypothetical protein